MTRTGELAGHLGGYEPELLTRATIQTVRLGLGYAVIPAEALHRDGSLPARHPLILETHRLLAGLCVDSHTVHDIDVIARCLLPEGHDGAHGYRRFLDGIGRGRQAMDDAHARLEARFAEARRRLR